MNQIYQITKAEELNIFCNIKQAIGNEQIGVRETLVPNALGCPHENYSCRLKTIGQNIVLERLYFRFHVEETEEEFTVKLIIKQKNLKDEIVRTLIAAEVGEIVVSHSVYISRYGRFFQDIFKDR